ncbi:MAG: sugar phosphate isomerase/epimerase [Selenomonadaceae bacterium]|nr:sugar phosphate isomerase/epimerase [Selenomonadaceae bacterium]
MLKLGVQTQGVIDDENPLEGFAMISRAGFSCVDFSLHGYLKNTDIYESRLNNFFDAPLAELKEFFTPHKEAAKAYGIAIHQMHMPYPIYQPKGKREVNEYLWQQVAPKSMELCAFLECRYIVVHGFKLQKYLGSEEAEWRETERFLDSILPLAKEHGIVVCLENLYDEVAGHIVEGSCAKAERVAERIDRINEKYQTEVLGFCFDMGHANLLGLDAESFLVTLGRRLKVLHLHDNDGLCDLHQIPFTFTRDRTNKASTDWEGLVRGLSKIQFDGVLNFETAPALTPFPVCMKADVLRFIGCIGEYLAGEIRRIGLTKEE